MMSEYKIEKNIPVPLRHNSLIPFGDIYRRMKVGDSVLFNSTEWKRARNQAYNHKPRLFTFRKVENGYRCWRVK